MAQAQLDLLAEGFDPLGQCESPSPWQEVIHGDSRQFRYRVVERLQLQGRAEKAVQFALCGCSDKVVDDGEQFGVRPKRCGHPLCPRCSRYRGLKFVRRVLGHLRGGSHGSLFHVVLTQEVHPEETLQATRERFEAAFQRWLRLHRERVEMRGMLATTHVTWSDEGGWHYHKHLVLESMLDADLASRRVEHAVAVWREIKLDEGDAKARVESWRLLCGPGAAMEELDDAQGDLWNEADDPVARAVQYVARDVCQGVESWNLRAAGGRLVELFEALEGQKMRRLYGPWRKAAPEVEVKAEQKNADGPQTFAAGTIELGTVDTILYAAGRGERDAIAAALGLLRGCRNNSGVGSRLVAVVGRFVHAETSAVLVA